MNTPPFRSHLMQQFYSAAKNQTRPPLVFASTFGSNTSNNEGSNRRQLHRKSTTPPSISTPLNASDLSRPISSSPRSLREASYEKKSASNDEAIQQHYEVNAPSRSAQSLQQMICSRRTVSNFLHQPPTLSPEGYNVNNTSVTQ